ncbi:MAG: prephenate dehydrogenase [Dehalococcoidales bacterium]|nr:prephenate dehydrogenase [Dehalococcoidales bacterium]
MKIAIIGGAGKMGRWFARFFVNEGKQVVISGRNQQKLLDARQQLRVEVASNIEAVKAADVVLLSVSIESFEPVVKEIAPHLHPGQIILDITSVKTKPVEVMHRYIKNGTVLGTHPLFGPGARGVANQNFVLTPTNAAETAFANKVKEYLEARRGKVTIMTPQEHDEMMSVILGLAHFIAIVSADTLLASNKMKEMAAIGGITYKVLVTLVESVLSEDPELYASLQMNLPGLAKAERLFQQRAGEWAGLVENNDRQQFIQRMKALRDQLEQNAPDFGKAYENLYKIADGL